MQDEELYKLSAAYAKKTIKHDFTSGLYPVAMVTVLCMIILTLPLL